jgi:hypothetical protein
MSKGPKEKLVNLPDAFTYSKEARCDLGKRAAHAAKLLQAKCRKDKGFCARYKKLLKVLKCRKP